jgi:hypothetical protein
MKRAKRAMKSPRGRTARRCAPIPQLGAVMIDLDAY